MLTYHKQFIFLNVRLCTMLKLLDTIIIRFSFFGQCCVMYNILRQTYLTDLSRLDISVLHLIVNGSYVKPPSSTEERLTVPLE